jgi:hypothetical protein
MRPQCELQVTVNDNSLIASPLLPKVRIVPIRLEAMHCLGLSESDAIWDPSPEALLSGQNAYFLGRFSPLFVFKYTWKMRFLSRWL